MVHFGRTRMSRLDREQRREILICVFIEWLDLGPSRPNRDIHSSTCENQDSVHPNQRRVNWQSVKPMAANCIEAQRTDQQNKRPIMKASEENGSMVMQCLRNTLNGSTPMPRGGKPNTGRAVHHLSWNEKPKRKGQYDVKKMLIYSERGYVKDGGEHSSINEAAMNTYSTGLFW